MGWLDGLTSMSVGYVLYDRYYFAQICLHSTLFESTLFFSTLFFQLLLFNCLGLDIAALSKAHINRIASPNSISTEYVSILVLTLYGRLVAVIPEIYTPLFLVPRPFLFAKLLFNGTSEAIPNSD